MEPVFDKIDRFVKVIEWTAILGESMLKAGVFYLLLKKVRPTCNVSCNISLDDLWRGKLLIQEDDNWNSRQRLLVDNIIE